jgi:large subunit ribosomal protein L24
MTKLKIRKGDNVKVIAGNDKGKTGRVLQVLKEKSRVIVEGVQMVTKHTKPSADNPNGGIVKKEAAIHISNVMLLDPASGKPTKIGRKVNEIKKLQRVAKITGEFIKDEQS